MSTNQVIIFDTTLRDGEQCPGAAMNLREKLEVARQLARLNVDVIEAGFPVISDGDFESVLSIAKEIKGPRIAGLARCVPKDIDAAGHAVKPAGRRGRIHVFLATSQIHREFKLGKAKGEILRLAVEGVKRAKGFVDDVEFSPEDASRTEPEFLIEVCKAAIAAGATTINIPDTVGWAIPDQFAALISRLRDGRDTILSSGRLHVSPSIVSRLLSTQTDMTTNVSHWLPHPLPDSPTAATAFARGSSATTALKACRKQPFESPPTLAPPRPCG